MHKVIELLKRAPGASVEDFQQRWLSRHGPLRAAVPGLRCYIQSHALPKGYRKGELVYDGIGEMWFDSEKAFETARRDEVWQTADRDLASFTDASRTVVMQVDVHVIKDGAIPRGAVKNIEFVNRRPGMDLEAFQAYWIDVHGPLASTIPVVRRYEQNHLKRLGYEDSEPAYDGLAITWFDSTDAMKEGTRTPQYEKTRADEPNFLAEGHLPIIITREHVIAPRGG